MGIKGVKGYSGSRGSPGMRVMPIMHDIKLVQCITGSSWSQRNQG